MHKNREASAAAQASRNVVQCTVAAIVVAFLQDLIGAIGVGWAFMLMEGLCLIALGVSQTTSGNAELNMEYT